MNSLIGTYDCKVDAKGRLMMPAGIKKQLVSILEDGFVLRRSVFQPCLELYPMREWQGVMQKVNKLNRFKKRITILFVVLTLAQKWLISMQADAC